MLPEYSEEKTHVSKWSLIQVDRKSYSVPSRLIGQTVRIRRYEEHLEVYVSGMLQLSMPRLTGDESPVALQHGRPDVCGGRRAQRSSSLRVRIWSPRLAATVSAAPRSVEAARPMTTVSVPAVVARA